MATFKATSSLGISGSYSNALDHTTPTALIGPNIIQDWTSGTGNDQANMWFADRRTFTNTETLDLYGGLTDMFGTTINFALIRELIIHHRGTSGTDENLEVSGDFFIGGIQVVLGTRMTIHPGGRFGVTNPLDGYPVTDGTADDLILTANLGGTITYDLFLIGTV